MRKIEKKFTVSEFAALTWVVPQVITRRCRITHDGLREFQVQIDKQKVWIMEPQLEKNQKILNTRKGLPIGVRAERLADIWIIVVADWPNFALRLKKFGKQIWKGF